ncbi:hypothetical protein KKA03_01680 [archaeon]|nr:hypothetical protein [archaeon]
MADLVASSYGMSEIYVEIFSGTLLFLSSLAGLIISHFIFGRDILHRGYLVRSLVISSRYDGIKFTEPGLLGWQSVSAAIVFSGLTGLGYSMKHLSDGATMVNFFHSLTVVSPAIALYFYHMGIEKHVRREYERRVLPKIIWGVVLFMLVVSMFSLLSKFYNDVAEIFLFFILVPIMIYAFFVIGVAIKAYGKHLIFVPTVSAMTILTAFLTLAILAGQFAQIIGNATLFLIAQSAKDAFISMTAASILIYSITMRVTMKHLSEGRAVERPARKPLLGARLSKIRIRI